jgi:hypothetical protein
MTPSRNTPVQQAVLRVHPKADCIHVESNYVVSAVFHSANGTYGCWPIGVSDTEEGAWASAALHKTVREA